MLATFGAKEAGATQAAVRQVGEIGEKSDEQRIMMIDLVTGAVQPLSPPERYVYEDDWAPDSRALIATMALGNGDNNWWMATLDAIDAGIGAVDRQAEDVDQHATRFARWAGHRPHLRPMSDFGSIDGDVWTVPFAGGEPINLTAGARAGATVRRLCAGAGQRVSPRATDVSC